MGVLYNTYMVVKTVYIRYRSIFRVKLILGSILPKPRTAYLSLEGTYNDVY